MTTEIAPKSQCPNCAKEGRDTSENNLAHYANGDYCFACGYTKGKYTAGLELVPGKPADLSSRHIDREIADKYGVKEKLFTGYMSKEYPQVVEELVHIFPYTENGITVKQKLRSVNIKNLMSARGNTKNKRLWGQDKFNPDNRWRVIITEGEYDAMAAFQMTGTPAVSIPNGSPSASQSILDNMEWLSQWKEVLLCFDNDEPGKLAVEKCIGLFEPGTVRNVTLPLKDANDMLKEGRTEEFKKAIWNAERIRPSTIVFPEDIREKVFTRPEYGSPWPWPSMTKATYGMRKGELYLLAAATSIGKEQPLSALISTPDGWKVMGDIRVGDKIHSRCGVTNVIGVYPQGMKPVFKITLEDGRTCEAGADHLWKVSSECQIEKNRKDGQFRGFIKTTKELITADLSKFKIKNCDPVFYAEKSYVIPPYSLGVLIGDGCLTMPGLNISSSEIDIIDRVASELKLEYTKNNHNFTYTFKTMAGGREYRKYLESIGLCVKSGNKFIPSEYLRGSVNQRLNLLKGLMDTDGSISKTGSFTFTTTSPRLAENVIELARSLGIIAVKRKESRSKYISGSCFLISLKTPQIIFSSDKHHKKYNVYLSKGRNRKYNWDYSKIKSIEYMREEESQCIMVDDGEHLYLTNDFIVTHNTEFVREIVNQLLENGQKAGVFSLEQQPEQTIQRYIGAAMGQRLYLPGCEGWDEEVMQTHYERFKHSVALYQPSSGVMSLDALLTNIRWLNKAEGMEFFVIDNLKALATNPQIDGKRVSIHDYASYCMGAFFTICKQLNLTVFVLNHLAEDKISKQAYVSTSPKNADEYLDRSSEDMQKYINRPGMTWETGRVPAIENIFGGGNIKDLTDFIIVLFRNRMSEDYNEHRKLGAKILKSRLDSTYEGYRWNMMFDYQLGRLIEEETRND